MNKKVNIGIKVKSVNIVNYGDDLGVFVRETDWVELLDAVADTIPREIIMDQLRKDLENE